VPLKSNIAGRRLKTHLVMGAFIREEEFEDGGKQQS